MLKKSLLTLLGVLIIVLWVAQPGQSQSTPEISTKKRAGGDLWPVMQQRKFGYIDQTGRLVIPYKFGYALDFSEGLAAVELNGNFGYIDKTGHFVIPPHFYTAYPFSEGLAVAVIRRFDQKGNITLNKFGYIDRSGRMVIEPQGVASPKELSFFSEGLACARQGEKIGYMDKTGKMVIAAQYIDANPFSEDLAAVTVANKYGYIDRSGKMVIPPQYDNVGPFCEGLAYVESNGNQGFIDKTGRMVIKGEAFVEARGFSEGLAAARGKNDKYGFIDKTGKFVILPQFHRVGDFSEGLAAVQPVEDHWPGDLAYINHSGQIVIKSMSTLPDRSMKAEFDLHYYGFSGGVARVSLGNEKDLDAEGYINKEGKFIWPRNAESLETTTNWKSYKTADISLRYPPDFKLESLEGQNGGGGYLDSGIVKIRFPDKAFRDENTNYRGAFLVVSKSTKPKTVANCTKFTDLGGSDNGIGRIKINGVDFKTRTIQEGAAGNRYESKLYRNVHKGSCYEIALVIHTVNKDCYEPPLKEFDKHKAYYILEQMRDTFTLIK